MVRRSLLDGPSGNPLAGYALSPFRSQPKALIGRRGALHDFLSDDFNHAYWTGAVVALACLGVFS